VILAYIIAIDQLFGLFVWLISHQPSEQTSHQQPASSIFLSEQISTSNQPNEQALMLPHAIILTLLEAPGKTKDASRLVSFVSCARRGPPL
jgi:hypothetical protein